MILSPKPIKILSSIKQEIANAIYFKICKILSITNDPEDYEKHLNFLNYEEVKNPLEHREKNEDFIYERIDHKT